MEKVRARVLEAVSAGMRHTDSVAIFTDTSEAYCRRILNELAADGDIKKITGRSHHTYLPILDGEQNGKIST